MPNPKKANRASSPSKPVPESASSTKPRVGGASAFTSDDPAACYAHFLPAARALGDAIPPTRGLDVQIAKANIDIGLKAIAKKHADIAGKTRVVVADLLELPALASALDYADTRVPGRTASTGEIADRIKRVSLPRKIGLKQIEVFADLDLIPRGRYNAIKAGTGKLDMAKDAVAIAALFADYPTLHHPIPATTLDGLKADGAWLVQNLSTEGANHDTTAERGPEQLLRDQLWKLLDDRYDQLRLAGGSVFGMRHVDDHIPPLHSRTHSSATTTTTTGSGTSDATTGGAAQTPPAGGST